MNELICCSNCNEVHPLSTLMSFDVSVSRCTECGTIEIKSWKYSFCTIKCMLEFIDKHKVKENGFPCKDCFHTGFLHIDGYPSLGTCPTCKGTKYVKESKAEK